MGYRKNIKYAVEGPERALRAIHSLLASLPADEDGDRLLSDAVRALGGESNEAWGCLYGLSLEGGVLRFCTESHAEAAPVCAQDLRDRGAKKVCYAIFDELDAEISLAYGDGSYRGSIRDKEGRHFAFVDGRPDYIDPRYRLS